jgi:26S proteasome regulatory subunit N9
MEDLWERRLWHQLTLELEKFFSDPQSAGSRMRMFKDFVGTFEKNINQSKLVGLGLLAKEECKGRLHSNLLNSDTTEALEFTTGLAEKVNTPATQDAYVYALVEAASLKLALGQGDAVRKDLDAANKILDTFDSIDTVIHAAFYRVSADFYSVCPHTLADNRTN